MALGVELPRLTYLVGLDRQMTDADPYRLGRAHWAPYGDPGRIRLSSYLPALEDEWVNLRPLVFTRAPFTTDDAGESFTAGTVFVAMTYRNASIAVTRSAGVTTTPLTTTLGGSATREQRQTVFVYTISGAIAGSAGNITIHGLTSGVDYAILPIDGNDGPNQTLMFSAFTAPDLTTDILQVVSSWPSGAPRYEQIHLLPWSDFDYFAVPATLPVDYTVRNDTDTNRGGTFVWPRSQSRPNRLRGSNYTYETLGLSASDLQMGIPAFQETDVSIALGANATYNVWIGQELKRYDWVPIARNRAITTAPASLVHYPDVTAVIPVPPFIIHVNPPQPAYREASVNVMRARALNLTWSTGDTLGNNITVELYQEATLILSRVFTAAECTAGGTTNYTASMLTKAHGVATSFTVRVYTVGGDYYDGDTITWTLKISPACDIPFPFAVATRQDDGSVAVAPGGYLPSWLASPAISPALVKLAAGVTSNAAGAPIQFIPANDPSSNCWMRVTVDGLDSYGCGESPFDHDQDKSIDRAHASRPFYALADGTALQTCAIAPYTPSNTAIPTGGATLTLDRGNWWAWGTASLPGAGGGAAGSSYVFSVRPTTLDQVRRGLTVEWSLTDVTVRDPDGRKEWNSVHLLERASTSASYKETRSDPPASPLTTDAYIVGDNPLNAWANIAPGTVVLFDTIANAWRQFEPEAGAFMRTSVGTDWVWYDGSAWKTSADTVLRITITVTGDTDVGFVLGAMSTARDGLSVTNQVRISWAAA